METIDIVDLNDQIVGQASRDEIYEKLHPHRIVHVLIFNQVGEMAMQKVAAHKQPYGGHWATSVGGHVQSGETYEEAAKREMLEEFGLEKDFNFMAKAIFNSPRGMTKFMKIYRTQYDRPDAIDSSETEKIEYFPLDTIKELRNSGEKFSPELLYILDSYF